jgi:hypothetical protein
MMPSDSWSTLLTNGSDICHSLVGGTHARLAAG